MQILWWHWLVLGLLLLAAEMASAGGFYIIFFGIGALIVGLLAAGDLGGPVWVQLLLFGVVSTLSLAFFRARLLQWMQLDPQMPAVDSLIGEIGVAGEDLAPGAIGKVELRGAAWSGRNVAARMLVRGTRCRVLSVDGLTLLVEPEGAR